MAQRKLGNCIFAFNVSGNPREVYVIYVRYLFRLFAIFYPFFSPDGRKLSSFSENMGKN